jgi:two-component sensor histidine kinase
MCPWVDFWKGEQQEKARAAVAAAKVGQVGQFERPAPTAKGHMRWWEVIVSPIRGRNGEVEKLLSISRDITVRHEAEAHQRVLFEEMHHRIKNTLASILAIVDESFCNASDVDAARRAIGERLQAMGKAHDLLIRNEWISADIRDVVAGAVNAYVGDVGRVSMAGEPVMLTSRAALTIAMVLNELCTNAAKYGAWSAKAGFVTISWIIEDDELCFRWSEQQGPSVHPPTRHGFGTQLIQNALPATLDGTATLSYDPKGLIFEFRAPLASFTAFFSDT